MPDWLDKVAQDFSDLPDIAEVLRMAVRLVMAALLGGILGYERERVGKAAGLRTHMLVSVGAALFVLVPQQAGMSQESISRIIQGLTAGIGFLGAGAIIKSNSEASIHGLTTAAGIWLTAAVGIAAGLGRLAAASVGTLLAFVILDVLGRVGGTIDPKRDEPTEPSAERKNKAKGKPRAE